MRLAEHAARLRSLVAVLSLAALASSVTHAKSTWVVVVVIVVNVRKKSEIQARVSVTTAKLCHYAGTLTDG